MTNARTSTEIADRVRYLLVRELDRRVQLSVQRLPGHCTHNYRHALDVRKTVDGEPNVNYNRIGLPVVQTIGLCMLGKENPEEWNGTICEDPVDAQRCPYFTGKVTKEQIRLDFETQVRDAKWLEVNLPEVYGLLWTLDRNAVVQLPWWKRLWFWFLRVRVEPMTGVPVERWLPERSDDHLGV
jgi:hypothetical protein